MNKILIYILSIPKTVYVNFRWFPLNVAIKMPIAVSYDTRFSVRGGILFNASIKPFLVRIGFHEVPACNRKSSKFEVNGKLIIGGEVHIGNGSNIFVGKNGVLTFGDDFKISASSSIICYHNIAFGKNIQFSWDCLVMDSDTHSIYDANGNIMNENKPISFGDDVWICCRCTILKGAKIPGNNVIGATTLVGAALFEKDSIIAGRPAKSIKKIGSFSVK